MNKAGRPPSLKVSQDWEPLLKTYNGPQGLADAAGVHVTTVYRWISGRSPKPKGATAKLLEALSKTTG